MQVSQASIVKLYSVRDVVSLDAIGIQCTHVYSRCDTLLCAPPPRPSPVLLPLGEHREPRREQPLV